MDAKYDDLAARLDRAPVQGISGADFRILTFGLFYNDATFPLAAELWQALDTDAPLPHPAPAPA